MKEISFKKAAKKMFEFRPDEAYSQTQFEDKLRDFEARALAFEKGETCFPKGLPPKTFFLLEVISKPLGRPVNGPVTRHKTNRRHA